MKLKAYSKITWTFNVLGRFPKKHVDSGYTNVRMVSFLIDLWDDVEINILETKNKKIIINCDNPQIPQTNNGDAEKNICAQAIIAMRKAIVDFPKNDIQVDIKKNIPLAGGLGGSSTDGVAVIKGLNQILRLNLNQKEITNIAAQIGSDTVFFASDYKVALTSGRGEIIEKLVSPVQKIWLVLVQPDIGILSRDTYNGLEKINYQNCAQTVNGKTQVDNLKEALAKQSDLKTLVNCLENDMEKSPATLQAHPVLDDIKNNLIKNGCLGALMSGGGSTVFGVCESEKEAKNITQKMRKIYSEFNVFNAATL